MGTPPSDLPPPPPGNVPPPQPSVSPTQIAGQEHVPTNTVPMSPTGSTYVQSSGQTNTLAVISLGAGVVAIFGHIVLPGIGGGTLALIAIVTGFMARQQIKHSGEQGMWMATVGMILGIVHIALLLLLVFIVIVAIFLFGLVLFGFHR
jgi:uncharacterized protein DUF4190